MNVSRFFLRNVLIVLSWVMLFIAASDFLSYVFLFPEHKNIIFCFYLLVIFISGGFLIFVRNFNVRNFVYFSLVLFVGWVTIIFINSSGSNEIDIKNHQLLNAFEIMKENVFVEKHGKSCIINLGHLEKMPVDPYSGNELISKYSNQECYIVSVGPDLRESDEVISPDAKDMVVYLNAKYWSYLILDNTAYSLSGYGDTNTKDIGIRFSYNKIN